MALSLEQLQENLAGVRRRIGAAQVRSGRRHEVQIVAATKYVEVADMEIVRRAGIGLVGENRVDELEEKWRRFKGQLEFHFIGHLQHRKVAEVLPCVSMIHSVESLRLVRAIDARAAGPVDVLLQVNVSGEDTKYGVAPTDAEAFLREAVPFEKVRFCGLMTMAPLVSDPEQARPVFRGLRELRDRLAEQFAPRYELAHLSMGMSNDFEIGVEEGATLVRLGSVLFSGSEGG